MDVKAEQIILEVCTSIEKQGGVTLYPAETNHHSKGWRSTHLIEIKDRSLIL